LEKNGGNDKIKTSGEIMKKEKVYSSDFKLQLVKKYLNSNKTMRELSDVYSALVNNISLWISKYEVSYLDESVLIPKKVDLNLLFLIIQRFFLSFMKQLA